MRTLLVAQAPGRSSDPREPLSGASGRRLAALCGLPLEQFLRRFDRANLLPAFPGKAGKGDAFPLQEARRRGVEMAERLAAADAVVLLGLNVARALGVRAAFFRPTKFYREGGDVFVAPHPSGISHWWNDPSNVSAARRFWRSLP